MDSQHYYHISLQKSTGDYHDEMTSEHFEKWFAETLLPNVKANTCSMTVMNNTTYHSRRSEPLPIKSWTKKRMIEWLQGTRQLVATNLLRDMSLPTTRCGDYSLQRQLVARHLVARHLVAAPARGATSRCAITRCYVNSLAN